MFLKVDSPEIVATDSFSKSTSISTSLKLIPDPTIGKMLSEISYKKNDPEPMKFTFTAPTATPP